MPGPDDTHWMTRALDLARGALGTTWPNPAVGCVIVADGEVIGEAATHPGGRPHAETQALTAAGPRAIGATAYVTLEPCAHHGQTGPCAEALANAGIAACVVAVTDPDPRVSGRGIAILQAAGIEVRQDVCSDAAAEVIAGFTTRIALGRPRLTLKLAQSLDGRIALASGVSRWITGPEARSHVHRMRARTDAILIGAGTARADDPMLDIREGVTTPRAPVRIVADSRLGLDRASRLVSSAGTQPLWLLHAPGADAGGLSRTGAELIETPATAQGLDLAAAFRTLGARGLTHVLCEGGGQLAASLIAAELVDELTVITSGKIIGGDGIPGVAALGATDLARVPRLVPRETLRLGADILTTWARPDPA